MLEPWVHPSNQYLTYEADSLCIQHACCSMRTHGFGSLIAYPTSELTFSGQWLSTGHPHRPSTADRCPASREPGYSQAPTGITSHHIEAWMLLWVLEQLARG